MIKDHFFFDPVQKRETNCNFTGCQMPHFMIMLILCISLLNFFGYKMSIFEEYGAFNFSQKTGFDISCKLSPMETICMTYQNQFLGKIRKIFQYAKNFTQSAKC